LALFDSDLDPDLKHWLSVTYITTLKDTDHTIFLVARTGSQLVGLSLGAIFLRDMVTAASLFPLLIAPQTAEEAPLHHKTSSRSVFFL
jgi:hypothetical protein